MAAVDAFLEAVKAGDRVRVSELLRNDPSLAGSRNAKGESAILMAAYRSRSDLVELLLASHAEWDIFEAAASGQVERARSLLAEHPDLANAFATDGFTPLGLACFFGHKRVAEILLAHGAAVNLPSNNEMKVMPLHSAAAGRHTAIVRLLLEHGADPNARQRSAFTALHSAAHNGEAEMVELLLSYGAEINARSDENLTPLRLAQDRGHTAVAEMLRARGGHE
jgi:ankyrin repeat protein